MAMDVQGSEKARPYVERAGATFTTLVDQGNHLGLLFGFKAIPNGLLIDERGLLDYRKFGGFDIRKQEYALLVEAWASGASPEWRLERMAEDKVGGAEHARAIAHFQHGLELYRQGRVQEALAQWRLGRDLEPDNFVIRKQIWAVEHPERFYDGDVDYDWQREQMRLGQ